MASFEQHLNGAVIATGIMITPLHSASLLDAKQSLIVLFLGLLGGVLPDLDSDTSKPLQIVLKIFSIFFPLVLLLNLSRENSLVELIIYWALSGFLLHISLFKIFTTFTTHRGIFHSIPMGILFGLITTYILNHQMNYSIIFSTIAGAFLSFGYIIHLLLDEFVSLNALGLEIKRSFGSAFKLYDKHNKIGTIIVYSAIAMLWYKYPIDKDIFIEIFNVVKNIKLI